MTGQGIEFGAVGLLCIDELGYLEPDRADRLIRQLHELAADDDAQVRD
ncbi:hypothetical protein ACWDGI_39385 [Streptomyces sp. NPDC001220]